MAKSRKLTATECASLKAGRLHDPGGPGELILEADRHGKRWYLRFVSPETGKRREAGLGAYSVTPLAKARERAEAMRNTLRKGLDPLAERERTTAAARAESAAAKVARTKAQTLEAVARDCYTSVAPRLSNDHYQKRWIAALEQHVFPFKKADDPRPPLGDRPIASIEVQDMLDLFGPLHERIPPTAKRIREQLVRVFKFAAVRDMMDRNPAWLISDEFRKRGGHQVEPQRSVHYDRIPALVAALRNDQRSDPVVRFALEFLILTAARSGEVRGARWKEFDLEAGTWTVPAGRMKLRQEHFVPLRLRTAEILKGVIDYSGGKPDALVFPGFADGKPMTDNTLMAPLRRMETGRKREDGKPETYYDLGGVHGMRTTFKSWSRTQPQIRELVSEAALAHKERDRMAATYATQAEYREEREQLAELWEQYCGSADDPRGDVIEEGQTESNNILRFRSKNGGQSATEYLARLSPVFAKACRRRGIPTGLDDAPRVRRERGK
jgi:integrase